MYVRLCEGKVINKVEEAQRFGVDERTIQRDLDDIRAFLDERSILHSTEHRSIKYDRTHKGFIMCGVEDALMSNSEILAVSKILLESRAFTKKEIGSILDKLIRGCVPQKNMKLVSDLISNEKYHYVELQHQTSTKDRLWELGTDIRDCELLEIQYEKKVPEKETVTRLIEPVALLFSEYYFYLNAYIVEKQGNEYVSKYNYPAIFRLDRIQDYRKIGKKYHIAYSDRFEEGEFRKKVQFMFAGELLRVKFKYYGTSIDVILDRLPTARIISGQGKEYLVEAEVFGKGILMWLLSQKDAVEVLKPDSLRKEMKNILTKMLEKYNDEIK